MKAEYINPFFVATQNVFKSMLDLEIERGPLGLVEEKITGLEANVIIGMTGDLAGSILYSFPKEMVMEMVRIMSGMKIEKMDAFVTSAIGEITNIITGNVATILAKQNYICDIVPPQIILDEHKAISMIVDKALYIPLKTSIGRLSITISLKEKQDMGKK